MYQYRVDRAKRSLFGKEKRAHLGGCILSKHLFRCLQSADIMDPVGTAAENSTASFLQSSIIVWTYNASQHFEKPPSLHLPSKHLLNQIKPWVSGTEMNFADGGQTLVDCINSEIIQLSLTVINCLLVLKCKKLVKMTVTGQYFKI